MIDPAVVASYDPKQLMGLVVAAAVKSVELYPTKEAYQAHRDETRVAQARQAALVRSAAQAPTLARDVTLERVLLGEQRARVQPSAGATDAGGVKAEMELMDATR